MGSCNKIINNFLCTHNLTKNNEQVLGVLFYGSRNYNTNNQNSDIDLLIVTDSYNNYKGVTYVDGIKIEYFEKNIYDLIEKIDNLEENNDHSLVSIFLNGTIIFSKNQTLELLKEEIISRIDLLKKNKKKKGSTPLLNEFLNFFNGLNEKNNFYDYIYHNLLENIRKVYHKENGYSSIPSMKTYELYNDIDYARKYYCVDLPDEDFINMYLKLAIEGYDKEHFDIMIDKIIHNDAMSFRQYKRIGKNELKYTSTIVANCVSKVSYFLENNHPIFLHYYYITLEKIRKLYCNMNDLDDRIGQFGFDYDNEFLSLFDECLNGDNKIQSVQKLFDFACKPLNMNYKEYKILEYVK